MVEYSKINIQPSDSVERMQDWRQAIQLPTAYRIGNSTVRLQYQFVVGVVVVGIIALVMFYNSTSHSKSYVQRYALENRIPNYESDHLYKHDFSSLKAYNSTYPFTQPVRTDKGVRYRVAIIADLDTASKRDDEWVSYLKTGFLFVDTEHEKVNISLLLVVLFSINIEFLKQVSVEWDAEDPITLKSSFAQGGRGMELSELVVFNGNLLAFDDRTGTIYHIDGRNAYPWVLLVDGHGKVSKGTNHDELAFSIIKTYCLSGFKSEWATVKDHQLYVGGLGKAWTTPTGELVNLHPQYIKRVSQTGEVTHIDWHLRYESLARAVGISFPGMVSI